MAEQKNSLTGASPGHELSDLSPRNIALFGAALALIIGLTLVVTYGLFHFNYGQVRRSRPSPSPLSYIREPTPEPRLLVKPGAELAALRAQENRLLQSYDWIDRDQGIVRIPINRAIDVIAGRDFAKRSMNTERRRIEPSRRQRKEPKR